MMYEIHLKRGIFIVFKRLQSMHQSTYSGAQKGRNNFVSKITNKVVSSFLGTTVPFVKGLKKGK